MLPIQHDRGARTPHRCICVSPASSTALSLTSGGKCIRRASASSRVACHGACRVASSCGYSACSAHGTFCTSHVQPGPGCSLWAALMANQTMLQQQGGGQSMQQQGGGAQPAGSKTARHKPVAGAADETPKSRNRRGKKKAKGQTSFHQCNNSSADQGSARACGARWFPVCCCFHFPAHSVSRA